MMSDFLPFDDQDAPSGPHESHFRRGFHHGALSIVRALQEGVSIEELEAFVNAELRAWRENHQTRSFPPEPGKSNLT